MVGLFSKAYLVKSKIWQFLKQSLAFFSYNLLANLSLSAALRLSMWMCIIALCTCRTSDTSFRDLILLGTANPLCVAQYI